MHKCKEKGKSMLPDHVGYFSVTIVGGGGGGGGAEVICMMYWAVRITLQCLVVLGRALFNDHRN